MDNVGVNLADRNQRRDCFRTNSPRRFSSFTYGTELSKERRAVALDDCFGVFLGESEVERAASVGSRKSTTAGGKSVNEPGKVAQVSCAKDVKFGLLGDPMGHPSMLTDEC